MKFSNLFKINKLEGKTIREIEAENLSNGSGKNYGVLLSLAAGTILVLLVLLVGWQINAQIKILKDENKNLITENTALKTEVSTLKHQLAGIAMTGKELQQVSKQESQPAELTDNDYIYHVIKSGEYLGVISNRYYGVPIYAPGLAKLNGLSVNTTLQVGQIIRVPSKPDELKSN